MTDRGRSSALAAAVAGDEIAFRRIIAANHDDMRRVALYVTRDRTLANEATQAAWVVAWRKLGQVRDEGHYPGIASRRRCGDGRCVLVGTRWRRARRCGYRRGHHHRGARRVRLVAAHRRCLWAIGRGGVYRIDRASIAVTDSLDVAGGPAVIAGRSLWVWSLGPDHSSLVEIDFGTRNVRNEYPNVDDAGIGRTDWWAANQDHWIGAVDGAIWMHERHLLTRFDVATSEFADPIQIDVMDELGSCCMALDEAIWLSGPSPEGTLLRFDVDDLEVTDTLEFGSGTGRGIAAAGAIWNTGSGTVHRIDPVTMEVTDIPVVTFRSRLPAYGYGVIWVAGGSTLSRIDVDTLEVSEVRVTTTPECRVDYTRAVSSGVAWIWAGGGYGCRVDLMTGEITRYR